MTAMTFPWRTDSSLAAVLATSRPSLEKNRIIAKGGGHSDAELDAAEQRLGRPLPSDVREFYGMIRPVALDWLDDDAPGEFGFYQLEDFQCLPLAEETLPDWDNAEVLLIGQT